MKNPTLLAMLLYFTLVQASFSNSENFKPINTCTDTVTSYPYGEFFGSNSNGGLGLWTQGTGDDGDWTIDSGGTTTSSTGPNGDFNPLNPSVHRTTGRYMYVETSNGADPGPGATTYLVSPCLDLTGYENGTFGFYYHMYGADIGTLSVEVSKNNGDSWTTLSTLTGQQQGSSAAPWLKQTISLSEYNNQSIIIRFKAVTIPNEEPAIKFKGDMAIDYITIKADVAPPSSDPPFAVCQNITVELDATGNATIIGEDIDGGSTDDVAITNYSIDINTFDCSDVDSPVNVTLTVSDADNQQNTCTATVTVIAPNLSAPTGANAVVVSDTEATINWNTESTYSYDLRYRAVESTTWIEILNLSTNTQALNTLSPETTYEVQLRGKCAGSVKTVYSNSVLFKTFNTGAFYCTTQGNSALNEWISRVQLNTIDNTSGRRIYTDFTEISTVLKKGITQSITVTPHIGNGNAAIIAVWIDYNGDGDFEDVGEEIFTSGATQSPINRNFIVPNTALEISTRMRVHRERSQGDPVAPCGTFSFGEVEDYTVVIKPEDGLLYSNSVWTPAAPSISTATKNVTILDGVYNVTNAINVKNITVSNGAGIIVEKTGSMTVKGQLITANNVILESDSDEFSSLIVDTPVVGDVFYKRHVNGTASSGANDLIAPPVYGQSFIDFRAANSNILSNGTNTQFLFGPFHKPTGAYLIYSNTETAALNDGMGYRAASTNSNTFTFRGSVKTTDVNENIEISGPAFTEWNLIGNPYPSYIKLSDFLSDNISKMNSERGGIYGYDGDTSDGWVIWNQAYSDANPNAKITPGQGFYVASATSNETIEFKSSMRTTGTGDDFISGRQTNTTPSISHIELMMDNDTHHFKTDFYFTDNASLGLDPGYDAGLFGSPHSFSLYSHLVEDHTGINFTIQSIGPDNLSSVVIPLGVHVLSGVQATLNITKRTLPDDIDVYLEDRLNNTFTLLNTSEYTFTADTDLSGTGRFYMTFVEAALSVSIEDKNNINIYTIKQPKALHINGQLFGDTLLNIYDIQGRVVNTTILKDSKTGHQVDISSLTNGIYVVHLKNNSQEKTQKILIN